MAKYNCIIKELPGDGKDPAKILGRMFIQDLSKIPDGWEVKLRDSLISRHTDIQNLMCTSTNPLLIYKKPDPAVITSSPPFTSSDEADETFWNKIRAILNYIRICFSQKSEEVTRIEACVGFDFDAVPINGLGVQTSFLWKSYRHGMNLAGECPNIECKSRNHAEGGNQVFYHNGYGEIYLPDDENKFNCPACGGSAFNISNFVLSCGRALFKYRKSGIDSEVKEFILESDGPLEEYKTFGMTDSDHPLTDYDFVLIMTVASNQSFYFCISCDKTIDEVDDEEMLTCGHSYHKSTCSSGSTMGCIVCQSQPLEPLPFLLTVGNN